MATKTIDDSNLTALANAIRGKNGSSATYKPSEMAAAISEIEKDQGAVVSTTLEYNHIFGISRGVTSSSPLWTRTDDAVGMTATASVGSTAGTSDFSNFYPWSGMVRETFSTGDVMVKIPEFYYQRYVKNKVEYIRIANYAEDGFFKHPGSGRYVGAYKTSNNNMSVSGATPITSNTRSTARASANSKGTGWWITDLAVHSAIKILYLVEFASNYSNSAVGEGNVSRSAALLDTGSCDNVPNLTGSIDSTSSSVDVVYRGIEGIWGNFGEWLDGAEAYNSTYSTAYYITADTTKYADDTTEGMDKIGSFSTNSTIIQMACADNLTWAIFPQRCQDNSKVGTYYCDRNTVYAARNSNYRNLVVSQYGLFSFYWYSTVTAPNRLMFIP